MPTVTERPVERLASPPRVPRPRAPRPIQFNPLLVETTPEARRRRKILVGVSVAAHVLLVVVVVLLPPAEQTVAEPSLPISIVFTTPPPSIEEPIRLPPPTPKALPRPPEPRVEVAPPPRPQPEPEMTVAPPPLAPEPPKAPIAETPRPRPTVRTGVLGEVNDAPAIVAGKTGRILVAQATGFESAAVSGSADPRERRVAAAAFDTGTAKGTVRRSSGGEVATAGFESEAAPVEAPRKREQPAEVLDSGVEILSKPKPVYTDEARRLRIEGDVVLKVTFSASGDLHVLGVLEGLGHGLDEAAVDAAKKLRFTPARRDGHPVDHTATLRVVFRLA